MFSAVRSVGSGSDCSASSERSPRELTLSQCCPTCCNDCRSEFNGFFLTACRLQRSLVPRRPRRAMDPNARRQKRRDTALSSLNTAIEALALAKEISRTASAKAVFGSVSVILTMIKVDSVHASVLVDCGLIENLCIEHDDERGAALTSVLPSAEG